MTSLNQLEHYICSYATLKVLCDIGCWWISILGTNLLWQFLVCMPYLKIKVSLDLISGHETCCQQAASLF